jgi:alanine-synthesizing transaminase
MGSVEFAKFLVTEADVAVSPGVGFGPDGDGHVRFALIENEQRIAQGIRSLRKALTRLEPSDSQAIDHGADGPAVAPIG